MPCQSGALFRSIREANQTAREGEREGERGKCWNSHEWIEGGEIKGWRGKGRDGVKLKGVRLKD